MDLRDKLLEDDKALLKKIIGVIPMIGIAMVILYVIVTIVVCRIQVSGLSKDYQAVQAEIEEFDSQQASEEKEEEEAVSALQLGRDVADLQTDYSQNRTEATWTKEEDALDALDKEVDSIQEELKPYFSDNSYKDCWYVGSEKISNPYWDFGTKYSFGMADEKMVPVVWVCYDHQPGGLVLGYAMADFDMESKLFSNARTVAFDVSEDTSPVDGRPTSILGMLQGDAVKVDAAASPEEVLTEESESEESDVPDTKESSSDDVQEADEETSSEATSDEMEGADSEETDEKESASDEETSSDTGAQSGIHLDE